VGEISMWATATAPSGYLLCDGTAVSRSTYSSLFAVLSTTFGTGDGTTTFNLPDFRDRMPIGAGTTYAANSSGGSANASVISHNHGGSTAADASHTHTFSGTSSGQSASHTHSMNYYMDDANGNNGYIGVVDGDNAISSNYQTGSTSNDHTHTYSGTTSAGSSHSHTITTDGVAGTNLNLPPYRGIYFIIKT
jgi:microcystin-dependent protein